MTSKLKSIADRYPLLRRFAVMLIVAGGLAAYAVVKPYLPHEHPVAYRFEPDASRVTDLEVTWMRDEAADDEPVSSARYHFEPGTGPRELRATVRAPDGRYRVEVTVSANGARKTETQQLELGEHVTRVKIGVPDPPAPRAPASSPPSANPDTTPPVSSAPGSRPR